MTSRDPRVDAFIAKARPFAKPILARIRGAVHQACPDCVETIKWGMPHFEYHGKTLCGMAAFKAHAALILWHAKDILGDADAKTFRRVTSVGDLPPRNVLAGFVTKAMALVDAGKPSMMRRTPTGRKPPRTPADLAAALKKNAKARAVYDAFAPSHKREYVEWITGAKTAPTRARRIETAVQWIADGKARNWKYMRK